MARAGEESPEQARGLGGRADVPGEVDSLDVTPLLVTQAVSVGVNQRCRRATD